MTFNSFYPIFQISGGKIVGKMGVGVWGVAWVVLWLYPLSEISHLKIRWIWYHFLFELLDWQMRQFLILKPWITAHLTKSRLRKSSTHSLSIFKGQIKKWKIVPHFWKWLSGIGGSHTRISQRSYLNQQGTSREKLRRCVIYYSKKRPNVADERIWAPLSFSYLHRGTQKQVISYRWKA